MTTERRDKEVLFQPISVAHAHMKSCIGQIDNRMGLFSITSAFNPGAGGAGDYKFNPNSATLAEINNVVATLILHLFGTR